LKLALGISAVDVQFTKGSWLISARGRGSRNCPGCGQQSDSYHGSYLRRLRDLPIQGALVTLEIPIMRWRCRTLDCSHKTFVEQLPQLALPFVRRTRRVSELVRLLGHATGGKPAERLLARLGMPMSDDTVLKQLKRCAATAPPPPPVRVAGIDDWGWTSDCTRSSSSRSRSGYSHGMFPAPAAASRNAAITSAGPVMINS
jgi:transposase